ncbi:hypothetical protein [Thiomicrorhabdus sp.]|uniref:hypothetical protein n=1 Tax=Thiomicrorhabdus sp. TaxID=2039724 RepID=UPI0029C68DA9|nr:hypothetical protein [Thiomicrorhabdus sp.]
MKNTLSLVILVLMLSGCATATNMPQQSMSASFYDMNEKSFSIQAVAPPQAIREYAICKVIWFAEKKKAEKVAIGDPRYGNSVRDTGGMGVEVPDGWLVVDATAYLAEPKETANPFNSVPELAKTCRASWDWYR